MAFFTGIAVAIGLTGAAATAFVAVGTNLLIAAVGYIGSAMFSSLAGKSADSGYGVSGKLQGGDDTPRVVSLGKLGTAGSLVYDGAWGEVDKTPNSYFVQVICVSDHPISGLTQVYVNNELVTLLTGSPTSMGYPVSEYRKDGVDYLWIKFYDGTQVTADSYLVSKFASSDHPYDSGRVGYGCGYVIATARTNSELFTGFPQFKFTLQGRKLYDISKDTTAGGSGSQRWSTPSTWGGDGDDLIGVQIYNLLRGITYAGQWLYGLQNMTDARLPASDWVAVVNKCRQTFNGPSGLEAQYRAGGELPVNSKISDSIEALLTGSQGRLAEMGGIYKLRVGAPGASVTTISDDTILSTTEQTFTPFFGLSESINGITAKYPNPAEGWNTKVAPPLYNSTFETEDGNRRLLADVNLDLVPYPGQVQRLMKSALAEARRARRHTISLPPEYWVVEPGEVITWTSLRNGYVNKKFRIDGYMDKPNADVILDITEVDPTDYDWNQGTDYRTPVDGPTVTVRPTPQAIIDWDAQPYTIDDNDGTPRRPAILLTWDGDQDDVREVEWQIRLFTTQERINESSTLRVSTGGAIVSAGILPNTHYEARGRYVPKSGRPTNWSNTWISVTSPNTLLGAEDVYDGVFDWSKFADEVNFQAAENSASVRELWEELNRIQIVTSDIDFRHFDNIKTLDRTLNSKLGLSEASFSEAIVVATGPDSALSQQITTLSASLDGLTLSTATAVEELQAFTTNIDGRVTSQSTSLTTLTTRVGSTETAISGQGTAISGLQTTTVQQGNLISSTSTALTQLTTRVANNETGQSGNTTAISSLQTLTQQQGTTLTSHGNSITGLTSTINGINGVVAGQATAISGLTTNVSSIDGRVTANSQSVTDLSASVNGNMANGLFRIKVDTDPPSGYNTRITLQGKYNTADIFKSAGLYIDVNATTARVVIRADRFVVTNADGTIKRPFIIQNNADGVQTVYMDQIEINGAKITSLSVDTLQVANSAISQMNVGIQATSPLGFTNLDPGTSFKTVASTSVTINKTIGSQKYAPGAVVLVIISCICELTQGVTGDPKLRAIRTNDNLVLISDQFSKEPGAGEFVYTLYGLDEDPVAGLNTWSFQMGKTTTAGSNFTIRGGVCVLQAFKK